MKKVVTLLGVLFMSLAFVGMSSAREGKTVIAGEFHQGTGSYDAYLTLLLMNPNDHHLKINKIKAYYPNGDPAVLKQDFPVPITLKAFESQAYDMSNYLNQVPAQPAGHGLNYLLEISWNVDANKNLRARLEVTIMSGGNIIGFKEDQFGVSDWPPEKKD
jgi:hypothetical protein